MSGTKLQRPGPRYGMWTCKWPWMPHCVWTKWNKNARNLIPELSGTYVLLCHSLLLLSPLSTLHFLEKKGLDFFEVNFMLHINWIFPLFLAAKKAGYIFRAEWLSSRANGTFWSLQQHSGGLYLLCSINKEVMVSSLDVPHLPSSTLKNHWSQTSSAVCSWDQLPSKVTLPWTSICGPSWADGVWKAWLINMFKYRRQSFLCAKQLLNITDRPAMDQQNSYGLMNLTHWRNGKWLKNHQMSTENGKYLPPTFHKQS